MARLALYLSLATVFCIAVVDAPVAHWVAAHDTHPVSWLAVLHVLEYAVGVEPWEWIGVIVLVTGTLAALLYRRGAVPWVAVTISHLLANNLTDLTGGPDGISSIPKPTVFGFEMARSASVEGAKTFHELIGLEYSGEHMVIFLYLIALVLVGFTLFVTSRLIRMPMGRAWEALRDDEIACRSLGLNPTRIKLSAFTLGAAFAGIGGAFFAARQGLVNPESFTFIESALILAIVVLGGMGSQLGVILAAILLTVLPEVARGFAEYRMLIFGLVMVLMMMWRPQGLLPASRPHVELPQ